MRRLLTSLLVATLLLGACGGDDGKDDGAAVTSIPDRTTSSTTSTTEAPVPPIDVIPSDPDLITEEYVEQVLNALYEVSHQAVELARAEGFVDQPSIEVIESIRTPSHAVEAINALIQRANGGFAGYSEHPTPTTADVTNVLVGTASCIFAEVVFDSSGTFVEDPPQPANLRSFVRLVPATQEQRASGSNPTAWAVDGLPFSTDGTTPPAGC